MGKPRRDQIHGLLSSLTLMQSIPTGRDEPMRNRARISPLGRGSAGGSDGQLASGNGYDAFISYSHAQSGLVAQALQRDLERFAKPWYRARRLRIFRDQTNLAASPQLWPMIEQSLAVADWFILMASPEAAQSRWVRREVEWWRSNKSAERILIALVAGEITWADNDFDWQQTNALPRELAGAFADEPLWIDLRLLMPGSAVVGRPDSKRDRSPELGDVVAEFAAPIHGTDKDNLIGEHVRQRRRTRRTVQSVIATLSLLLVVAITGGVLAVQQRSEAVRQRNEAVRQRDVANARRIAAQADALRERRPDVSLLLAVEALKIAPVVEARTSLAQTLAQSHYSGNLLGHQGQINQVAANPTGKGVATASDDGTVALWDTSDRLHRVRLSTLDGFGGPVVAVDFDQSGKLLAAGGPTSTMLWDISDQTRPRVLVSLAGSDAVRFKPQGNVLFAADQLWSISDPSQPVSLAPVPTDAGIRDADISADGRTLVIAARPASTKLWDISNPRRPMRLAELSDLGDAVALSPNGRMLMLAPRDGAAHMWDIKDPTHPVRAGNLAGTTGVTVFDMAFSPNGRIAATAENDGTTVWDLGDPAHPVQSYRLHGHLHDVYTVAFTRHGSLITGGPGGVAMVWSTANQRSAVAWANLGPFNGAPSIVRFSPDDRTLITAGDRDPTYLWDLADRERPPVRMATIGTPQDFTLKVAISPDGSLLARDVTEHPPSLWDITDRRHPVNLGPIGDVPGQAGFAPDGHTVIRHSGTGRVDLWDISRREHPVRIGAVRNSGTVGFWAQFSPDGRTLAIAGPETTELWNVTERAKPIKLATIAGVGRSIAFRPDGLLLAATSSDTMLSLWDISRLDRPIMVGSVPGENGGDDLAFSPDGLTVVAGSSDAVATVWDVSSPAFPIQVGQALGHGGSVYNIALSADGRTLATGSFDRTVRLWAMPPAIAHVRDPVAVACALAGPNLSREDWKRYLSNLPERSIC
jgi:WD40 repeat protein